MSNVIKLKRGSGSDPSASDLVIGELALRTDTGKIFLKKDNGNVAEVSGGGGLSDGDKGDIVVSNSGDTLTIDNGVVTGAKIANATINASDKLENSSITENKLGSGVVTSAKIADGTIATGDIADDAITAAKIADGAINNAGMVVGAVIGSINIINNSLLNADINVNAAIAGSKISPNFGRQNVVTTGTLGSGNLTITNDYPTINLTDTNNNDFRIQNRNGVFSIVDTDNSLSLIHI